MSDNVTPFIDFLDSVVPMTKEGKAFMKSRLFTLSLGKGEYAYEIGSVCHRIGFVTDGVLRVVQLNEDGSEYTKYFINEGHFSVDLESFSSGLPSQEYQEALTPCRMIVMTKEMAEVFHTHVEGFSRAVSILTERALLEKIKIKSEMFTDDAPTRYEKLLERNPSIIQRVPLQVISSYLGVNQATLSRIRKQLR
ncbi:MAG: Crp/Fnr family transcriptional regulator [Cytophagaceae bacterium]|jgi:CRP-like cAMP-binding protein|nr:Crp/Fnr family transcriptional regulator [Cytophagaceae bacterium]